MGATVTQLRANQPPLVEVGHFDQEPAFRQNWADILGPHYKFVTERYWRFNGDSDGSAAKGVGKMVMGVIDCNSKFRDISTNPVLGEYYGTPAAYLSLIVSTHSSAIMPDPEQYATELVEITNSELLAIHSPYILPVSPEE